MEADIEKLMSSKSFKELTTQEREEWQDLFTTEEEYDQMKSMFAGLEMIREEKFEPAAKTKKSLDDLFAETYGAEEKITAPTFWTKVFPQEKSFFQRPLVQIAAAVLLIVLAVPFLTQNKFENSPVQVAKNGMAEETKTETTIGPAGETKSMNPGSTLAKNVLVPPRSVAEEVPSEDLFGMDENVGTVESVYGSSAPPPVAHSDLDWEKEEEVSVGYASVSTVAVKSTSAAEQKGVLDLLTVSF